MRSRGAASGNRTGSVPAGRRDLSRNSSRLGSDQRLPRLSSGSRSPAHPAATSSQEPEAGLPPVPSSHAASRSRSTASSMARGRNSSAPGLRAGRSSRRVAAGAAAAIESSSYDVALRGKVFTGWILGRCSFAECVAFSRENGRICFVGSYAELQDQTDKKKLQRAVWHRTYDVSGLILPAFHDAHCHPFGAGNRKRQWDNPLAKEEDQEYRAAALDLSHCTSWDEVLAACSRAISERSEAGKLEGTFLAEKCDAELIKPLRQRIAAELDNLLPKQPLVLLIGERAEAVAVNRVAIRALLKKFDTWTFDSTDKRISRTATRAREPSGYFAGAVWAMRFALLSPASVASQGLRGLRDGLLELPKHGIVACTDAFVFEDRIPCFELAYAEDSKRQLPRTSLALGFKNDWSVDCISEIVARAPAMRRTWEDTNFQYCLREAKVEVDHGREISWEKAKLESVVNRMVASDFSMHMHIFYNEAAKHSISLLLAAESRHSGGRHKLAHAFELKPEDVEILCKTPSVYVAYQPLWFRHRHSYDEEAIGAHVQLVRNGGKVCYGSDWDISDLNPLQGLRAILSRDGVYSKERAWSERLADALRMYTLEAARAMWLEDCSGSLEVGKFADICVVDKDLFEMPEKEFCFNIDEETRFTLWFEGPPVKVTATFSRGFCIFQQRPEEGPAVLERSRSTMPPTADPEYGTDEEFLCGTCSCAPKAAHCAGC